MEYIGASINDNTVNNLHFADDIDLIARQLGDLQHQLNKVKEVSTFYGLEISETKTKWLVMRHEDSINNLGRLLTLKEKPLQKVDQFHYLFATITSNDNCTADIIIRTATALSVMSSLSSIFKNRKIASKPKFVFINQQYNPSPYMDMKLGH